MQELNREEASAENAEIIALVEAMYAAYNRRDWDAFFAVVDPEYEWAPVEEGVFYRGREEVVAYHERWLQSWEEFQIELEHLEVAPGGDQGFAIAGYRGKIATSEVPIEGRFFQVGELREGKIWRGKEYVDAAEARAAFERLATVPDADPEDHEPS